MMIIEYLKIFLYTGIAAFPLTGFVAGLFLCADCAGFWGNTIGRVVIGFVFAFLNTFSFGFPPKNEGGVGEPYNLLPYTIAVWIALFLLVIYFTRK